MNIRSALALVGLIVGGVATSHADEPIVTIEGGMQDTDDYSWEITNHGDKPIVYVEFPHFHADLFTPPRGWEIECTFLVNVGVPEKPGICTATATDPADGIQPGRTARFDMRIAKLETYRGEGEAKLRFSDGTETIVGGVELPRGLTLAERSGPALGFAVVVLIMILVGTRARKKRAAADEPGD